MRSMWLVVVFLECATLSGCSTTMLLKKQKLEYLTAEYASLGETKKLLDATANPEASGQFSIFVSQDTINNVLKVADGVKGPIPGVQGAIFHVDSVRAAFSEGLPILDIKAWAEKPQWKLKLQMTVTAAIEPIKSGISPSEMQFRVHITKVVPIASWWWLHFRIWGFARDLLQVKVAEYAKLLPDFKIPLQQDFVLTNPAANRLIRMSSPDGYVDGTVSVPGFEYHGQLSVNQVLFLSDGIHILASTR